MGGSIQPSTRRVFFWFRRDLRLHDNHGLFQALKSGAAVVPVFIFDSFILSRLSDPLDRRVDFIRRQVAVLQQSLREVGSELLIRFGAPLEVFRELQQTYRTEGVYLNQDHDPYPLKRDAAVKAFMTSMGCFFKEYQDHHIFERDQILSEKGTPYTVFTPYSKKWLKRLASDVEALAAYPSETLREAFDRTLAPQKKWPGLPHFSFPGPLELPELRTGGGWLPVPDVDSQVLKHYELCRNHIWDPSATSQLGLPIRFGTVSIRALARQGVSLSQAWLLELAWRDFFSQVLYHFPHVVNRSFRQELDLISWNQSAEDFERWKEGMTGFPLIDAGMRQLKQTGCMPNRVRMNVASFLCKDLLIHWSLGERYFAQVLLDYDLASNNGNWQWAAGTGCDAAPYFRVFNPEVQRAKFDPQGLYVKHWVSEWDTPQYPKPMVDHQQAARKAIAAFGQARALRPS